MPIPARPAFYHETHAINTYVNFLLDTPALANREQLIMMSGVYLNNIPLIEYAVNIDPAVVNTPIANDVITHLKGIFSSDESSDEQE